MNTLSNVVLVGMTLAFCVLAIMGLFWLDELMGPVEVIGNTPSARAELRAIYGGGFGGLAFASFTAFRQPRYRRFVFALLAIMFALFSGARALSIILDGPSNPHSVMLHALEGASFIVAFICWRQAGEPEDPPQETG